MAGHSPTVRLLDVAHLGDVEIVLDQIFDQEAAQVTGDRDVHRNVAVSAHDGLDDLRVPGPWRWPSRDQRRAVAPVHGERRPVVVGEPLVLLVGGAYGAV